MNILLLGIGSRGDVQPLLALAGGLAAAGHTTTIAAGPNFQDWGEDAGFRFAPLGTDVQELMNSDAGRNWVENSSRNPIIGLRFMRHMINQISEQATKDLLHISQDADVIVSGLIPFGLAEVIAQQEGKKHILASFVPTKLSRQPEVNMIPWWPWGASFLNRWSGRLSLRLTFGVIRDMTNTLREQHNLAPWKGRDFVKAWNNTPTLYGLSPISTPPAEDWLGQNAVTGYWFYDDHGDWEPPQDLLDFLAVGSPPVYVGFGSMSNGDPQGTLQPVLNAIHQMTNDTKVQARAKELGKRITAETGVKNAVQAIEEWSQ